MSYMNAMTVRIPRDLERELRKLCKQQHRSPSEVVRESLRQHIALEQLCDLRRQLRPHAEAAGFLTEDDVFKAVS